MSSRQLVIDTRSPPDTERMYRKFGGAYPALVEVLLQLRPNAVCVWSA